SSSKRQKLADNGDQRIEQPIKKIISDEEDDLEDDFSHEKTSVHDSDYLNESTTQKTSHIATSSGEVHDPDYLNESTTKKILHTATSSTSRGQDTATVLSSSSSSARMVTSTATSHKDSEDDFERRDAFTELQNASNEFEVALWVAHHPSVLNLANTIHDAMKAKITDNKVSLNTTNPYNTMLNRPEIDKEECKALFLRTRNNTTELYKELIIKVCKIKKSDYRLGTLAKDMGYWFDSYRYKLYVAISSLADEFSETYDQEEIPSIGELSDFITDDVWKQVLKLHLKATDLPALKNDPEMFNKLGTFVRQAVRNVLIAQKNEQNIRSAIRKCDKITIDLKIPTKIGIVKTLPVRELLNL
ncbi:29525_t:CDS:2, partial [Racocetra persica]